MQHGRCRAVTEFEKLNRIGEGTYGIVCKYNKQVIRRAFYLNVYSQIGPEILEQIV